MKDFVDYAFYGDVVGKSVQQVRAVYKLYCKLFDVEEVDNMEAEICKECGLFIEKGVFTK